jgi:hypothetical protein
MLLGLSARLHIAGRGPISLRPPCVGSSVAEDEIRLLTFYFRNLTWGLIFYWLFVINIFVSNIFHEPICIKMRRVIVEKQIEEA